MNGAGWTPFDLLELAKIGLSMLATGGAAYLAVAIKMQRFADRLEFHKERIDELREDIEYAHRRINDLPCRPFQRSEVGRS